MHSKFTQSNSTIKAALALVLSVSLLATGCTAQWISVALADLPVLTQMALNVATLAVTLQSGKQVNPAEAAAIQNISAEASKDLNLLQTLYNQYKANPSVTTLQQDRSRAHDHQHQPAGAAGGGAHQRSGTFGADHGGGESDSGDSAELCRADSAKLAFRVADGRRADAAVAQSERFEEALERASVRSDGECGSGCGVCDLRDPVEQNQQQRKHRDNKTTKDNNHTGHAGNTKDCL